MSVNPQPEVHEIQPGEGYDIDSDEFELEDEGDMIPDAEYDQLVEEGMSPTFSLSTTRGEVDKQLKMDSLRRKWRR